ncbi:leucyl/phenylalanyl-tRNA--protein transferase [Hydrogenophaga electricum]|uniref:Leucyl/phenylalanyl-tRNA--protein transferase n=1 Tax=Hydrogenophaga electricum TaxID=1230953 RepID=A0ABQ6BZB1_9BURK|nr:leucyl/phenylalanyl-tRNA--protein transferase [Hydrogenophaga electricum]GLS13322.1 leucyl/phenylalanyl-tRNA--protein transferase [Hydrogenophaga electricum]
MTRLQDIHPLPWLEPGEAFPPVEEAWGPTEPAPGLLAAGGVLDVPTLVGAYSRGIFPWYSAGQPILWWSTDPRMVLDPARFRLHRSLRKTLSSLLRDARLEIRFDHDFERVIRNCAHTPRRGQDGTWILPAMVQAYSELHQAGSAHSVEAWIDGDLAGGLYCINLGAMVYGESMFSRRNDASKLALAALVAFARHHHLPLIDCQQETPHLASMGAATMPRAEFCRHLRQALQHPSPAWRFDPVYWNHLFTDTDPQA